MDKNINELEKELREAFEKLAIISDTISEIDLGTGVNDIQYGSRVLITWEDGRTIEGRVWIVKGYGVYGINRDGYAKTINLGVNRQGLTKHTLQNLSVGTYGKLEREKWILSVEISEIQNQIKFIGKKNVSYVHQIEGSNNSGMIIHQNNYDDKLIIQENSHLKEKITSLETEVGNLKEIIALIRSKQS